MQKNEIEQMDHWQAQSTSIRWELKNIVESIYQTEIIANQVEYAEFDFNENGQLVLERLYDSTKTLITTKRHFYDDNGFTTEVIGVQADGDSVWSKSDYYNDFKSVSWSLDFNHLLQFKMVDVVFNELGRDSIFVHYSTDNKPIDSLIYERDSVNNIISERSYYPDFKLTRYEYQNDELTINFIYDKNDNLISTTETIYKYDSQGNWIERLNRHKTGDTLNLFRRELKYY